MKILLVIAVFIFPMISLDSVAVTTLDVSGNYSGSQKWEADTVKITGDVIIDGTLAINAGVYVEFQGHYELWADSIIAHGLVNDSVTICMHDTIGFSNKNISDGGWKRIAARSYMEFEFCRIMSGKGAANDVPFPDLGSGLFVIFEQSEIPLVIRNSMFSNNYASENLISIVDASNTFEITNTLFIGNTFNSFRSFSTGISTIEKCNFYGNSGEMNNIRFSSTSFEKNSNLLLSVGSEGTLSLDGCKILGNENLSIIPGSAYSHFRMKNTSITNNNNLTLSCYGIAGLVISGNLICGNTFKSGILFLDCSFGGDHLMLVNNTIYNNHLNSGTDPFIVMSNNNYIEFDNNILSKNGSPGGILISFKDYFSDQVLPFRGSFHNNLIEGGLNSIQYDGMEGSAEANIDTDPLFVMPESFDFHLRDDSPCINSGTLQVDGYQFSLKDLDGNPRILDFRVDIGAYEVKPSHTEIYSQPHAGNYCRGDDVSLVVDAFGGVAGYQWQKDGTDISGASGDTLYIPDADTILSGYYSCRIITADSSINSDTVEVKIYPAPAVFLGNDTTIRTKSEVILDAGEGFSDYIWNTGASDRYLPVTHSEPGVFAYFVKVKDSNGCIAGDTISINVEVADAVPGLFLNNELKLYPNPASGFVYLESSLEMKNVKVAITNSGGKTVGEYTIENLGKGQVYPIDLSRLEDGIYFVVLNNVPVRFIKISR